MPQEIEPEPGKTAWLKDRSPFPLPPGWTDKQMVLVMRRAGYDYVVRAASGAGEELQVKRTQLDAGWMFATRRGGQMHESHPSVLAALRLAVESGMQSPHEAGRSTARRWAWVLTRNGVACDVPSEPPQHQGPRIVEPSFVAWRGTGEPSLTCPEGHEQTTDSGDTAEDRHDSGRRLAEQK